MRLYEYEGKMLFKEYKIPVPRSVLIGNISELSELDKVVYPVVLKAQIFVGGRGKSGIIKIVNSYSEAVDEIKGMLGKSVSGYEIKKILVEEKIPISHEFYISATIDRTIHKLLLIVSKEGGMDIEAIAKTSPKSIIKQYVDVGVRPDAYLGRQLASKMGITGNGVVEAGAIISNMYNLFLSCEAKLVEINPLVMTSNGKFIALDSKVDIDEDAMFRHPILKKLGIEARHEVGELTASEQIAKSAGIPYVELDGDIGVFPGGAGFGIASLDLITKFGGKPANFMDSGGAPTQERLQLMIGLLINNPRVKAIFGARFGGISRCDDWAKAVVKYVIENKPSKPMIMRMAGNMEAEGREIFNEAFKEHPDLFKKIKIYKSDTPIEEVIKETIKVAKSL